MLLHRIATLTDTQIVRFLTLKSATSSLEATDAESKVISDLIDPLFMSALELDSDSFEWLSGLTRISLKDVSGFGHIAKEYDISKSKANIFQAI